MRQGADGTLWTSLCSGTARADAADTHISYGRAARAIGPETRAHLTGRVSVVDYSTAPMRPLLSGLVIATGDAGTYSAPIDSAGAFVLESLPRGTYRVFADLPGFDPIPNTRRIDDPDGCRPLVVPVYYGSRLSGRMVTSAGEPVAGMPLHLVPPDEVQRPSEFRTRGWTGLDGTFELRAIPPGNYLLGLNASTAWPTSVAPRPQVFHPGVTDPAEADLLSIGVNEQRLVADFVVPDEISLVPILGVVLDEIGQPISNARVTVSGVFGELTTGADGTFLLSLVRGVRCRVSAGIVTERDGRPAGTQSGYTIVDPASDAPPIVITIAPRPPEPPARLVAPAKVTDVRPVFPMSARQEGVSGTVILEATIGEDGRVRDARVIQSVEQLDQAALEAVRQWEFTPARLGGEPVAVLLTVTMHFQLD